MDIEEGDDAMDIDEPVPVTPIIERKLNEFPTENSDPNASISHNEITSTTYGTPVSSRLQGSENRVSEGNSIIKDSVPTSEPSIVILDDEDEKLNVSSTSEQNSQEITGKKEVGLQEHENRCFNKQCKRMSSQFISASDICLAFFQVPRVENKDMEICTTCYAFFLKNNKKPIRINEPVKDIIDLVDKPKNSNRCINTNCMGNSLKFIYAPDFCLSYFRVKRSYGNREEICMDCYELSVIDNDKLAESLIKGNLLFEVDFPIINETLQIDDSDEEDEDENQLEEFIPLSNLDFIADNIDSVLEETIEKLGLKNHLEKERKYLKDVADKVAQSSEELVKEVNEIRLSLDTIQLDLYSHFRPEFRNLKGIMILDDYSLSPTLQIRPENNPPSDSIQRKSNRIVQKPIVKEDIATPLSKETTQGNPGIVEIPKDLPVSLVVDKPVPQIDGLYYIAKENNIQGCWIKARLQQIIQPNTTYKGQLYTELSYRLTELKQQKERIVTGKYLAYINPCRSRLTVGTRVLSVFKETNRIPGTKIARSDPYYAGIVGENPVESNFYRYLIFFDIGYAQYVNHHGINLVFEADAQVWKDMPEDSRPFIQKYLESQDRPMVKLIPGQTVRVEYNGKWWLCTIKHVDCSLVKVYFDQINRWEWIYRGSTRLSPMYREELAASTRHTGIRTPRKLGPNESAAVVQYSRNEEFVQSSQKENTPPSETRAVARKSTTKPNSVNQPAPKAVRFLPPIQPTSNASGPTSKIMYFTPRDQQVTRQEYKLHECGPMCKTFITHNFTKLRGHNPLSKPLLCGWARMTLKDRGRKEIIYKAPCGRMIRNISEIHYYLRVTESEMTVDLFDFNHMVRCLAEFSVDCVPDPKDLSKGVEQVPIPVINGLSTEALDFWNYSITRIPTDGVLLNVDEEFLCGCDCEDDCVDKLKCACWKLTLEGIKFLAKDTDPISVGYIYRRLQEQVITGIYECNSRCKCTSTCLNRVAQNPMSLKLQVFKTPNRGWGIRCLNDIPQGTFICCYAGTLHTEQRANEDGKEYGDEYFAELDYIETVEKFKEDYEAEVMEEEEYMEREKTPPIDEPKHTKSSGKKRSRLRERKRKDEEDRKEKGKRDKEEKRDRSEIKMKQDSGVPDKDVASIIEKISDKVDTVTISDEEDDGNREVLSFNPKTKDVDERSLKHVSVRELFGPEEKDNIYIMDAKNAGNIGRFLNHSCSPNVFVQNVFVDTQDLRFPWVAFFSSQFIRAGTELTWNYNYDIGSVPGRVLYCHCSSTECKGRLL
ncbi:histone-lysine N-methyltransferase eggless-like isoform X2 [Anthonomus grandis grandis]|uniref:histone-lysine N-methyltransferase eggless-like isoform X2 n=1 Tax=Anthonomus grandis grandis TaxID=2921223 RepID=UPI0021652140|nr:histone-lysine N-methyltransferase eggless-like isoform X2 [Anthonomus grandis grandis]